MNEEDRDRARQQDLATLDYFTELRDYLEHEGPSAYERARRERRRQERAARRGRWLQPIGWLRSGRRVVTLSTILLLIGATTWAATKIGSRSRPAANGHPITAASGQAGSEAWKLQAWLDGGQLCRALLAGGVEQSSCQPLPQADGAQTLTLVSASNRYAAGLAGAKVRLVRVRIGAVTVEATTRPLPSDAINAGLPRGLRWYLASLHRRD
jgi:hypothetical protein